MPDPTQVQSVAAAQARVADAQQSFVLSTPDGVRAGTASLEAAAEALRSVNGLDEDGRDALLALQRQLAQVRTLLDQAAELNAGWARTIAPPGDAYTPSGEPAEAPALHALHTEG